MSAKIYVHPVGPFSEKLVSEALLEAGQSDQHELKDVKKNGKAEKLRMYLINSEFLLSLYEYRSRDMKLKFDVYLENNFAIMKWELLSPMSRKKAYAMKSMPGMSKSELERIIRSGKLGEFIASIKKEVG